MLSYSSLKTSPKVTLPSVEMWGTNMNILRDPPKSIYTRRIDKVTDTQQITLQEADANDRRLENIKVYARNVNPMVGVSYNNYGNTSKQGSGQKQATLPYKVENVRPPLLSQYDLQPLSRLPRDWFYTFSNPEFPQLVNNLQCNDGKRCIQQKTQATDVITNKLRQAYLPLHDSNLKLNRTPLNVNADTNKSLGVYPSKNPMSDSIIPENTITKISKATSHSASSANKSMKLGRGKDIQELTSILPKMESKSTKNRSVPRTTNASKPLSTIHQKTAIQLSKKISNLTVNTNKYSKTNHVLSNTPVNIRTNARSLAGSVETAKDIRYFSSGAILDKNLPTLESKLPSYSMVTNLSRSGDSEQLKQSPIYNAPDSKTVVKDVQTPQLFYFEPKETYINTKFDLKDTLKSGALDPKPSSIPSVKLETENVRNPLSWNGSKINKKSQLAQTIRQANTTL